MVARHFKYMYNAHIPPKTIFIKMSLTNDVLTNPIDLTTEKNKRYFSRRKQIKYLMKQINSYIDFNSQTYFLMLYYMDIIFTHPDLEKVFYSHFTLWYQFPIHEDLQMSNYVLLSLACLVIASKFNENDPMIPSMSSYIRLLYEFSKKKYIFHLDSLFLAEIVVLKILKYKLNFYTIYHYLIFFFTHGIVLKKTIERSKINKKISERKILEKIYIKVREIFDEVIENEKYYGYFCGRNNYEIVVEILLWCAEKVLDEKIKDDENIFKLIFGINIDPKKKKEIYTIIEELHSKINKRNTLNKSSRFNETNNNSNNNTNNNKNINNNTNNNNNTNPVQSKTNNIKMSHNQIENLNTDTNSIKQKINIKNSYNDFSDSNSKGYNRNPIQKNISSDFNQISKELNDNPLNRLNFSAQISYSENQNNSQLNGATNIKYGPNKRIYLTSNKTNATNTIFNMDSNEKIELINNIEVKNQSRNDYDLKKRFFSNRELNVYSDQIEKEPNDNKKISKDDTTKIIFINNNIDYNEKRLRKKSLSCSKNDNNENNNEHFKPRPSDYIRNNKEKKLNIQEKIKNTRIEPPPSSRELNKYYFTHIANEQKKEKQKTKPEEKEKVKEKTKENVKRVKIKEKKEKAEKPLVKKEILIDSNNNQISEYKKYLLTKSLVQKKSLNLGPIKNDKNESKIMKDIIVNRTKYLDSNDIELKKMNVTLESEPQDNYKRKSVNKNYVDSKKKKISINKSYNKGNTFIINNNIQINTLIDDKSRNLFIYHNEGIGDDFKYTYENNYKNKKADAQIKKRNDNNSNKNI